ncbi:uncharacterized protein F4812DRAFT_471580 [Daldinia caldariorum]|uniref:uncharacterized protein n=1 Tax=Daldinia caldariorum TaxID=326644 RepID=UPI002007D1BE|nr:uncharacterized protein F4812DRAFT_471580 [Daldinia caldariorum]KAI1467605.1 hypothetical protein F4812DRAFT_471580 [Daldinia caldariorum]
MDFSNEKSFRRPSHVTRFFARDYRQVASPPFWTSEIVDPPWMLVCTSRFHPKVEAGSLRMKIIRPDNQPQYTCQDCRNKWKKRAASIEHPRKLEEQRPGQPERENLQLGLPDKKRLCLRENAYTEMKTEGVEKEKEKEKEVRYDERKLGEQDENIRGKERRRMAAKTTTVTPLPLEIISAISSRSLYCKSQCVFDLLVPDWHACEPYNPLVSNNTLNLTRVVTYTRGIAGKFGSLKTNFGHGNDGHVFLPVKIPSRLSMINKCWNDENMRICLLEGAQIFELTADGLPHNVAEESFLKDRVDIFPIRGKHSKGILPYDDEQPGAEKKTMLSGSPLIFKLLRHIVVRSPLALMKVDARSMVGPEIQINNDNLEDLNWRIDLDRGSPIWLSWSQMPMLESVLLDLRIYSHDLNTERGCIGKGEIIKRAQEMCRWLRLNLLVIAGLKSYSFDTSYDVYSMELIEEVDEIDGEPNWVKIFLKALRPGGQLILIDRLIDESIDIFFA